VLGALPATAWLFTGCSSSGPRYLTDTERRVLAACADAIYPPDDTGPGAAELGAVDFIDNLLTAFEHDPPRGAARGRRCRYLRGTLRFGSDPASSVCRPDGRFHDIGNLYGTGASLFPTSSGFNPTLTIAMLATYVAASALFPGAPERALG